MNQKLDFNRIRGWKLRCFGLLLLVMPLAEAYGNIFYDVFNHSLLTRRFLDQWSIFCAKVYVHVPSPQITAGFLAACETGLNQDPDLSLMQAENPKTMIHKNQIVLNAWFFVPYEPQWIKTVPLIQALYSHPQEGVAKYRVIRNLGKMVSSLVSDQWFVDIHRESPSPNGYYRTQVWTAQVAPYNRDNHALIEVLVKRSVALADLKRVIAILPTDGGAVVFHHLAMDRGKDFESGSLTFPAGKAEFDDFKVQNKNLKALIIKDLGTPYRLD